MKKSVLVFPHLSDAQLIFWFQHGSNAAFDELVNRYSGILKTYINSILHNPEESKDVAQDTWEEVLALLHKHEYKEEEHFYRWIQSIAHHIALKAIKPRGIYVNNPDILDELFDEVPVEDMSTLQKRLLHRALSHLNKRMHKIIYKHFFLKMTFKEIALKLKVSLGYITSTNSKAIKILREELVAPAF
jgi:RNA polymerase sigma factor (sigma-70 family)